MEKDNFLDVGSYMKLSELAGRIICDIQRDIYMTGKSEMPLKAFLKLRSQNFGQDRGWIEVQYIVNNLCKLFKWHPTFLFGEGTVQIRKFTEDEGIKR